MISISRNELELEFVSVSVIFVDSGHIVLVQKLSVVRVLGGRVTLMLGLP